MTIFASKGFGDENNLIRFHIASPLIWLRSFILGGFLAIINLHKHTLHYILLGRIYQRIYTSRLPVVSCRAKKKQVIRDERVSYLQVAPL